MSITVYDKGQLQFFFHLHRSFVSYLLARHWQKYWKEKEAVRKSFQILSIKLFVPSLQSPLWEAYQPMTSEKNSFTIFRKFVLDYTFWLARYLQQFSLCVTSQTSQNPLEINNFSENSNYARLLKGLSSVSELCLSRDCNTDT